MRTTTGCSGLRKHKFVQRLFAEYSVVLVLSYSPACRQLAVPISSSLFWPDLPDRSLSLTSRSLSPPARPLSVVTPASTMATRESDIIDPFAARGTNTVVRSFSLFSLGFITSSGPPATITINGATF